ncbi:LOW QUALITY PROTEIN: Gag-Pol polyprotein, partial [Plecturocebus cupreus]
MVPNPYTLLSFLNPNHHYYTILDLKDAFFCIPLAPIGKPIFAFKWTNLDTGVSEQLTWTRLPQGFKNSPTLCNKALSQNLATFQAKFPECTLLQYGDDLLMASKTQEACKEAAQFQVQAVLQIPTPTTKCQVQEFLGVVKYCRLWILGFAKIAKPLYACTGGNQPLIWSLVKQQAFNKLKASLTSAPALALPHISKLFQLFVRKKQGIMKGVLTQTLGPCLWVASLPSVHGSNSPVGKGSGQTNSGAEIKPSSTPCMSQENPYITQQIINVIQTAQPDLTNVPLRNPEKVLYTDDSSFIVNRVCGGSRSRPRADHLCSGPSIISAFWAEVIDLIKALNLAKGKTVTIYTNSRYAFATAHAGSHVTSKTTDPPCNPAHPSSATYSSTPQVSRTLQKNRVPHRTPQDGRALDKDTHQATHSGQTKLTELLKAKYYITHLHKLIKEITTRCDVCARVNPGGNRSSQVGVRLRGTSPGEHWEVDFTEIKPPANGYKYLLVFIDTFSGWVKAFLTSSGQVKQVNRTLKETLTKFILEAGENWVSLLPFVILCVQCTPYLKGFSPFKIMFGRPPRLLPRPIDTVHAEVHNYTLLKSLQTLQSVQSQIHQLIKDTHHTPLNLADQPTHPFQPGDSFLIRHLRPHPPLEGTLHGYPGHTHRTQGGRTNNLDSSHPCQDCPTGKTVEHQTLIPQFTKAKTSALFEVTTLATLIRAVNPYSNPHLGPTYYHWVLSEGSIGGY